MDSENSDIPEWNSNEISYTHPSHLDSSLCLKIWDSLSTLSSILKSIESSDNLLLSFNGGKDSSVMFYLMQAAFSNLSKENSIISYLIENGYEDHIPNISLQINTWRYAFFEFKEEEEFQEIIEYCDEIAKEFHISIDKFSGKIKEDLEKLVNEENITNVLIGNRRTDPYSLKLQAVEHSSEGWPDFTRVHPILDWTYQEIWDFLNFFKFNVWCLYEEGYTSLGRVHNTRKNPYLLKVNNGDTAAEYYPAWFLKDGSKERESRIK